MSTEPEHDKTAEAFRHTYQRMVDRASLTEPEWPPVPAVRDVTPRLRSLRSGWQVTAIAFLITGAFGVGWLTAPGPSPGAADPFQVQTGTTEVPVPDTASIPYSSPAEAAIAAALAQNPDLADAEVTRIVGIYADDTIVDLRVQVQTDAFCHWYGVTGHVRQEALEWRGGPAAPCDP